MPRGIERTAYHICPITARIAAHMRVNKRVGARMLAQVQDGPPPQRYNPPWLRRTR